VIHGATIVKIAAHSVLISPVNACTVAIKATSLTTTFVSAQLDLWTLEAIALSQLNVPKVNSEPKETPASRAQMRIVSNALMKLVSAGPVKQVSLL